MKLSKTEILKIIDFEVVVDCYSDEEVLMGWWTYLGDKITYPFEAEYEIKTKKGKKWEKVTVTDCATDGDDFGGNAYYVEIEYNGILIPTKLKDLRNVDADEETLKAIVVWAYENK